MIDEDVHLPEAIRGYDWREAFAYARETNRCEGARCSDAGFTREDVEHVIATSDGENDGPNWVGVFKLRDGRYAALSAGCDYTGWDCQAGGQAWVSNTLPRLIQLGLGDDERDRLALTYTRATGVRLNGKPLPKRLA